MAGEARLLDASAFLGRLVSGGREAPVHERTLMSRPENPRAGLGVPGHQPQAPWNFFPGCGVYLVEVES